jgi:hypothetical protein
MSHVSRDVNRAIEFKNFGLSYLLPQRRYNPFRRTEERGDFYYDKKTFYYSSFFFVIKKYINVTPLQKTLFLSPIGLMNNNP